MDRLGHRDPVQPGYLRSREELLEGLLRAAVAETVRAIDDTTMSGTDVERWDGGPPLG